MIDAYNFQKNVEGPTKDISGLFNIKDLVCKTDVAINKYISELKQTSALNNYLLEKEIKNTVKKLKNLVEELEKIKSVPYATVPQVGDKVILKNHPEYGTSGVIIDAKFYGGDDAVYTVKRDETGIESIIMASDFEVVSNINEEKYYMVMDDTDVEFDESFEAPAETEETVSSSENL